jgi:hypothetical protein
LRGLLVVDDELDFKGNERFISIGLKSANMGELE